jgi:hypothetical protein
MSNLLAQLDDMLSWPTHEILEEPATLRPTDEWICYQETHCPDCRKSFGLAVRIRDWVDLQRRLEGGKVACDCGGSLEGDLSN